MPKSFLLCDVRNDIALSALCCVKVWPLESGFSKKKIVGF